MTLQPDDYVVLPCLCCIDTTSKKKLLDISLNYRDGSTVTLIHSCPACGKQTKSVYNLFSQGPLNKGQGYKLKEYNKKELKP